MLSPGSIDSSETSTFWFLFCGFLIWTFFCDKDSLHINMEPSYAAICLSPGKVPGCQTKIELNREPDLNSYSSETRTELKTILAWHHACEHQNRSALF